MSFDYSLLGRKLREARESLLIEPQEVAERLQISVDEYLRLESGEREATGDEVVILAAFYRVTFDISSQETIRRQSLKYRKCFAKMRLSPSVIELPFKSSLVSVNTKHF